MNLTLAFQLGKPAAELQRSDIIAYIQQHGIQYLCFQYPDLENRLREVMIPVNSIEYAHRVLAAGERVDGSSIFKGIIPSGESDLYIVPNYSTAYLNPFLDKTVNIVCSFLNRHEQEADFTPQNLLKNAWQRIVDEQGLELWGLGELEFYLIGHRQYEDYLLEPQRGYHQSSPFLKFRNVNLEIGRILSDITANVKYVHGEVGYIRDLQWHGKTCHAEQYEIEFLPAPLPVAALNLSIARWVAENVAAAHELQISFQPKLQKGHAGTGLHFHLELLRGGNNIMRGEDGELSREAKAMLSALCEYAPSLTALGNRSESSYRRLVPNHESPTTVYWNELDRNALIRIPLGWRNGEDLASVINLNNRENYHSPYHRQTAELRSADGSAHHYFLLAGICQAVYSGLSDQEHYAGKAAYYNRRQQDTALKLPASCSESALLFRSSREKYADVFNDRIVDHIIQVLSEAK